MVNENTGGSPAIGDVGGVGGVGREHILRRRKIIQLANAMGGQSGARSVMALCDDGSVWQCMRTSAEPSIKGIHAEWMLLDIREVEHAQI